MAEVNCLIALDTRKNSDCCVVFFFFFFFFFYLVDDNCVVSSVKTISLEFLVFY